MSSVASTVEKKYKIVLLRSGVYAPGMVVGIPSTHLLVVLNLLVAVDDHVEIANMGVERDVNILNAIPMRCLDMMRLADNSLMHDVSLVPTALFSIFVIYLIKIKHFCF